MTNEISDYEQDWLNIYWKCWGKRPSHIVMAKAGALVEDWGWDEVKKEMIICAERGWGWATVVKFFEKKQLKREDLEKQAAASGAKRTDARAYEGRDWEKEQELTPEAKALLKGGSDEQTETK